MKTQQQFAFDKAHHGVRKQGRLSIGATGCPYRSLDGTGACGIGHLIPDSLYNSEFDQVADSNVLDLIKDRPDFLEALKVGGVDPVVVSVEFLLDLQKTHDSSVGRQSMKNFERNMAALAKSYGLEYKEKA